jgi:hypothetical protein
LKYADGEDCLRREEDAISLTAIAAIKTNRIVCSVCFLAILFSSRRQRILGKNALAPPFI